MYKRNKLQKLILYAAILICDLLWILSVCLSVCNVNRKAKKKRFKASSNRCANFQLKLSGRVEVAKFGERTSAVPAEAPRILRPGSLTYAQRPHAKCEKISTVF